MLGSKCSTRFFMIFYRNLSRNSPERKRAPSIFSLQEFILQINEPDIPPRIHKFFGKLLNAFQKFFRKLLRKFYRESFKRFFLKLIQEFAQGIHTDTLTEVSPINFQDVSPRILESFKCACGNASRSSSRIFFFPGDPLGFLPGAYQEIVQKILPGIVLSKILTHVSVGLFHKSSPKNSSISVVIVLLAVLLEILMSSIGVLKRSFEDYLPVNSFRRLREFFKNFFLRIFLEFIPKVFPEFLRKFFRALLQNRPDASPGDLPEVPH